MSLTKADLEQIRQITEEVTERVSERVSERVVGRAVANLATKDDVAAVSDKIDQVRDMLSEDFRAESYRVTKIDKRLKKLRREYNAHVAAA